MATLLELLQRQKSAGSIQETSTPQFGAGTTILDKAKALGIKPEGRPAPEIDVPEKPGFLGGIAKTAGEIGRGILGFGKDILTGGAKGAISTLTGAERLGAKGLGLLGVKVPEINVPEKTTPSGVGETLGFGAEQIGEYFIPGGLEAKAGKSLEELVNTAKFAERFGPEAGKTLSGILKILGRGGITGLSTAGVSGIQTGGDITKIEEAGTLGFAAGALGKTLETFGPGIARTLEKSNFRLSPIQEVRLGNKATSAANFIADNKVIGGPATKFAKLSNLSGEFENAIQQSVGKEAQVQVMVPTRYLIDEIKKLPEIFKDDPAVYKQAVSEANQAVGTIQKTQGKEMSLNSLLEGKRSWGKAAFRDTQAKTISEGKYALEQAYENVLDDAMSKTASTIKIPSELQGYFGGKKEISLSEFNKVYSQVINARKLTNLAQFRRDTGLVGRLFGLWAGKTVGYALTGGLGGEIAGGALGEIISSRFPSYAKSIAGSLVQRGSTVPYAAKGILGIGRTFDQSQ